MVSSTNWGRVWDVVFGAFFYGVERELKKLQKIGKKLVRTNDGV
jgi:hypothetical protein